ncbi:MAG: c-type cytochrome [Labilithrix sp.]|nr:c-type cytochrome [Labilithrix sp.]MCW5815160.1 c-type cytochrome [Labilithrix sp.]
MKWTNVVMALTFTFAAASVWACGDDDNGGIVNKANPCGPDDPETEIDESECKELADVDSGRQAITTRGCQQCHGDDMAGQDTRLATKESYTKSITGEEVFLYPPNLTNDEETGVGKWSDDALAVAIRAGIDNESQTLCPQMRHFSTMSDFEVYSIVMYLRSIPKVTKNIPRSICPPTKTAEQQ